MMVIHIGGTRPSLPANSCLPGADRGEVARAMIQKELRMFTLLGPRNPSNCDGSTRRDFLKVGALGLGGFLLPDLLRARAAAQAAGKTSTQHLGRLALARRRPDPRRNLRSRRCPRRWSSAAPSAR